MLNLKQITEYYPENLRAFRKNLLREYLQYKILEIIFSSPLSHKLSFLGGTALRMIYDNTRFSEDLDFDNFGLSERDFSQLTKQIKTRLEKQGYQVETRNVFKGAYRCYIKLPKVLYNSDLSDLAEEKIMVQIDTASHDFDYQPDKKILNKFDVFEQINVTPLDILLSQKIFAVLNRKHPKGRDFFDVVFLLQKTKPNYNYLQQKIKISNANQLKEKLTVYSKDLDFNDIIKDVQPFLFNPSDSKKIKIFHDYMRQAQL